MKRLFASLAFAAGLTLLTVGSYGQTPIASLPYTISSGGNYYLTQNLTYSGAAGNAITVNASNVTIDLNGYQLFCSNSNNSTWGIYANNVSNVSIKNGAIDGFTFGIELGFPGGGSNVNFGHLVDGVRFSNDLESVAFYTTRGCVVRNCQIDGGLYGVVFNNGAGNRASNNVATGVGYGFTSIGAHYFDSNYADSCTYTGIYAASGTATKLRFNTTTNCGVAVYGGTSEGASDQ
jgi:parallel beta-helix repeat protein